MGVPLLYILVPGNSLNIYSGRKKYFQSLPKSTWLPINVTSLKGNI
jgi:hypothetical protein